MTFAYEGDFEHKASMAIFHGAVNTLGFTHENRLAKYDLCWNYYIGNHWGPNVPDGFGQITINFTKAFVKKLRRFTYRNDWNAVFTEEEGGATIQEWVVDVWENQNDIHDITNKLAENGGIFGDWYLYVQWVPPEEDSDGEGHIKLTSLDPRYVFPEYNTLTGNMEICTILIPYTRTTITNGEVYRDDYVHREIHTIDTIFVTELGTNNDVHDFYEQPNPIGKMLVVHGVNQPLASSNFGGSDIEDIMGLQRLLNEKTSEISDIIDYHAAPVTVIFGAKTRSLEKGANKVWSIPNPAARVENLSSEGNIPASEAFVQTLKRWMHELGNIPEDSLGSSREISNTSAVALSIDFEPLIEVAEDKRYYFAKGIKQANELIIDIGNSVGKLKSISKKSYKHTIEFGALLPRDRAADLADITIELSNNLETPEGALKRLGVKDIPKKIEELKKFKEEKVEEQRANFDMQQEKMQNNMANATAKNEGAAAKAVNSNPKVHGEQVSAAATKKKE